MTPWSLGAPDTGNSLKVALSESSKMACLKYVRILSELCQNCVTGDRYKEWINKRDTWVYSLMSQNRVRILSRTKLWLHFENTPPPQLHSPKSRLRTLQGFPCTCGGAQHTSELPSKQRYRKCKRGVRKHISGRHRWKSGAQNQTCCYSALHWIQRIQETYFKNNWILRFQAWLPHAPASQDNGGLHKIFLIT